VRSFPAESYLVVYRIRSSEVQILRVYHGKRDTKSIAKDI